MRPPPGADRRQLLRVGAPAEPAGLQRVLADEILVIDVQRRERRTPDRLLHRVHQREQGRRVEHPVPALDGALQHLRDQVHGTIGQQVRRLRAEDRGEIDEFAQPLP